MGLHEVKHFVDDKGKHGCRCNCGWAPPDRYLTRQLVEDEVMKHEANVARAQAALKPRAAASQGVLKSERDWYLERASDPQETPENQRIWQRLADELTPRIKDRAASEEGQTELW